MTTSETLFAAAHAATDPTVRASLTEAAKKAKKAEAALGSRAFTDKRGTVHRVGGTSFTTGTHAGTDYARIKGDPHLKGAGYAKFEERTITAISPNGEKLAFNSNGKPDYTSYHGSLDTRERAEAKVIAQLQRFALELKLKLEVTYDLIAQIEREPGKPRYTSETVPVPLPKEPD